MIRNYLKIALRTLQKYKGYTIINVFGLAIGLASSILIMMYVQDELSYDQHHSKKEQIYRVTFQGRIRSNDIRTALSPMPMASVLKRDYPLVKEVVRLQPLNKSVIKIGERKFIEDNMLYADSSVFDVFTMPFVEGNPEKALSSPNQVVLTESLARQYFGHASPMGKTIKWINGDMELEVTGVIEDCPGSSHFQYDMLVSFLSSGQIDNQMWLSTRIYTYLVLQQGIAAEELERQFPAMIEEYVGPQIQDIFGGSLSQFNEAGNSWGYHLQPLTDIYLHSDYDHEIGATGSMNNVYFFSVIAVFLVVIAAINFMNLATAKSANRAKEVGVRKVNGSSRRQLVIQFISEAFMITFLGLILALVMVELALPVFNQFTDKTLEIHYLENPLFVLILLVIGLLVGLLAGSYPAFYLSAFNPVSVLKGRISSGSRNSKLRGTLVVFQFLIAIVLVISTIIVNRQMRFINHKDLGFNKEHVMVVNRVSELGAQQEAFRQEILDHPNVLAASYSRNVPGRINTTTAFYPEGSSANESMVMDFSATDPHFKKTYGLEMARGRFFSTDYATDSLGVLINETAMKQFGFEEPIGKTITLMDSGEEGNIDFKVVGVMKDFNFKSLHHKIQPLILYYINQDFSHLSIRLGSGDPKGALDFIRGKWKRFVHSTPLDYSFLKNDWASKYRQEQKVGTLFTVFSLLAIFISCLGLFGLASFMAEQRTKEIGVRKVYGASVPRVLCLLFREILILVGLATLIGWPLSYYWMNNWLEHFAYRIDISPIAFLLASFLTLLISLATVGYRAYGAATSNPAESLKDE